jgi:hypothetical protein
MWSNHPENHELPGNHPEDDPEKTLVTPRFDDEAIRQAKPAIPLSQIVAARVNPKVLIVAVLVAGLIGSLIGSVLAVRYFNQRAESKPGVAESAQTSETHDRPPATEENAPATPANANLSHPSTNKPQENPSPDKEKSAPVPETAQAPSRESMNKDAADQPPDGVDRETNSQELNQAFRTWLKANQDGDVDSQMGYYHSKVNAFYRKRGVSPEAVRAEKSRVLGRANAIRIEASEPDVQISPDGQQATIRYRKRYKIEGEEVNREGEVLQELRWKRVKSKWRIVSERDVKVLNRE